MGLIPQTSDSLRQWAAFTSKTRSYFESLGFIEVATPHLVDQGAFESSIDPLGCEWSNGKGQLHTSPEIQMKAILAKVSYPIFQICHCFRDEMESPSHSREFTLLEFYQKGRSYTDMMTLSEGFISSLIKSPLAFERYSVQEVFLKFTGISLNKMSDRDTFYSTVQEMGILTCTDDDSWEDIFFKVFLERIEPNLNPDSPTFLFDYPIAVSPLSKATANGFFAERFELYWKGLELCNGCTELADPSTLANRHWSESQKRVARKKAPHTLSPLLAQATAEIGLAAGVAFGMDRLFLAVHPPLFNKL